MPDLPAIIKTLAEMAGPCQDHYDPIDGKARRHCKLCDGMGRIALFKELRVPCPCCQDPSDPCECLLCFGTITCHPCQGRGWVPESNEKVACWEIAKARADACNTPEEAQHLIDVMAEDSLLVDTLAWAQEQQK